MSSLKVKLFSQPNSGFGLSVCPSTCPLAPLCVETLIPGGEAQVSGLIRPGDLILKVNGVDISYLSSEDALGIMNEAMNQPEMKLLIRPPLGYTTKLETTFDTDGSPRTYRVTEKVFSLTNDGNSSAPKTMSTTINLNLRETKPTNGNDVKRR